MSPRRRPPWDELAREARARFGIRSFRPGQRELLEHVFAGEDALGVLPTGGGKSLCYQLPALFLPGAVVVVSPLIGLMRDQEDKAEEAHIEAARLDSSLRRSEERETLETIEDGESRIVYVTPERLEKAETLDLLRERGVALFVVDEAHCVSQWGHDFRPAYLGLRDAIRDLGRPPVLALTATATPEVARDVLEQLDVPGARIVHEGLDRDNLFLEVERCVNDETKLERLRARLEAAQGSAIVYAATIRIAEEVHATLLREGFAATLYHGKLPAQDRERSQRRFMSGETRVMVATKAFGLGIDKPDIRLVAHWNFPDSPESYYQEAGRAGRDGAPATATLFYRLEDRRIQAWFLGGKYPGREDSSRVYEALRASPRERNQAVIAEATGLPKRRVQAIVALLESAGVAERSRGRVVSVREFETREAFDAFLAAYEARTDADRARLEAIMRYAETAICRVRFLKEYFSVAADEHCGHCDVCRDGARALRPSRPAAAPSRRRTRRAATDATPAKRDRGRGRRFAAGDPVEHRTFGAGDVVEVRGDTVVVAFPRAGRKAIRSSHLRRTRGRRRPQP